MKYLSREIVQGGNKNMKVIAKKKKKQKTNKKKSSSRVWDINEDFSSWQASIHHDQSHSFSKVQFSHLERGLIITHPVILFHSEQEKKDINNKTPNCQL